MNNIVIGVDFDNTIAAYDDLMHGLGLEDGLINAGISVNKQNIRDHIRSLENGELKWQELQAKAYGTFMHRAKLIDGVQDFFLSCAKQGIGIYIISHKTQFAAQDKDKVDLHKAALKWIDAQGFFQKDRVFFESDRLIKIGRIISLGCTHFIDDLEEVLLDKTFPKGVQKILYAPRGRPKTNQDLLVKSSWKGIDEYFFTKIRE